MTITRARFVSAAYRIGRATAQHRQAKPHAIALLSAMRTPSVMQVLLLSLLGGAHALAVARGSVAGARMALPARRTTPLAMAELRSAAPQLSTSVAAFCMTMLATSPVGAFDLGEALNQPLVTIDENGYAINPVAYLLLFLVGGYTQIRPKREAETEEAVAARAAARAEAAAKNQAFIDEAAQAPGATVLESGLVFEELVAGEGEPPRIGSEVIVHYEGVLADGTVFDSSFARGKPSEFRLGMVIAGWNEGLQLMRPGGSARLTIPAPLAYGPRASEKIPANSVLQFKVDLLEVKGRAGTRGGEVMMMAGKKEEPPKPTGLAFVVSSAFKASRPPRNPPRPTKEQQAEFDAQPWSLGKMFESIARASRYRRLETYEEIYGAAESDIKKKKK